MTAPKITNAEEVPTRYGSEIVVEFEHDDDAIAVEWWLKFAGSDDEKGPIYQKPVSSPWRQRGSRTEANHVRCRQSVANKWSEFSRWTEIVPGKPPRRGR